MNYIGSKNRLIEFLESSILEVVGESRGVFCDLFAGTGVVGSHFKKLGFDVVSNDLQYYSYVLNRHLVGNHKPMEFKSGLSLLINELMVSEDRTKTVFEYFNNLKKYEKGFVYNNYCSGGTMSQEHQRTYFTDENGLICDTIRNTIEYWRGKYINEDEYFFLLASLIESIDKRANTTSVYGAYLKDFKKSSLEKMVFEPLPIIECDECNVVINHGDANELIKTIECDVVYLDPPYNNRVYGDYYHLLETIARNDNPDIGGKTGNRKDRTISSYSRKSEAKKAFEDLFKNINSKYVFLSYNDEGILSFDEIKSIMETRGEYGFFVTDYQRFKSDKTESRNHKKEGTVEYLHYIKCF